MGDDLKPRRGRERRQQAAENGAEDLRVAVPLRASTDKQENSAEVQLGEVVDYCALKGLKIVGPFEDTISASQPFFSRPGVQRMVSVMEKEGITRILASRMDRAFRSVADFVTAVAEIEERGWRLQIVDGDIDTGTPLGRVQSQLLVMMAEFELRMRQQRQLGTFELLRRQGRVCSGQDRYGWDRIPGTKGVRPNWYEQGIMRDMRELREEEHSFSAIAQVLNARGVPTKNAGEIRKRGGKEYVVSGTWRASTVESVLDHAVFADGYEDEKAG